MITEPQNKLIDHNDLFVLDLYPSLRTLCLNSVIKYKSCLDLRELPLSVKHEVDLMTRDNRISTPLKTLPFG